MALTSQSKDFPKWYQDVVAKAELAEGGPVRGTMVIRPYGYSIWERMQAEVDVRIKATGTQNAYFPLFIPEEYLQKEATHLEGFSPELAVVTYGGGKELSEPVVVRPTSETIINSFIAKWVKSHRDLPLKLNQWANVVRWEMRPRIFLRTTEFLWQEGHTAHATEEEAWDFAVQILNEVYRDFMEGVLKVPVFTGIKTEAEKFPGATHSLACEAMMKDGKALQMGTSHALGQSFSKMFNIKYLDKDGEHFVWQTSWGVSSRMMGGLIMTHGDDSGLNIPSGLAPIQVVIIVVKDDPEVLEMADKISNELIEAGVRVVVDTSTQESVGRRSVDWEIKGIPVRLELGPRDVKENQAILVRRDLAQNKDLAKAPVSLDDVVSKTSDALLEAEEQIAKAALTQKNENTFPVKSIDEALEATKTGFAVMPWDDLGASGEAVLLENGVSVRCLQKSSPENERDLPKSTDEPNLVAILARAY